MKCVFLKFPFGIGVGASPVSVNIINIKILIIDYFINKKKLYTVKEITLINLNTRCEFEKILEQILYINLLLVILLGKVLIIY